MPPQSSQRMLQMRRVYTRRAGRQVPASRPVQAARRFERGPLDAAPATVAARQGKRL